MTDQAPIRCPECNRTEIEGHAERCPHNHPVTSATGQKIECCPECGGRIGQTHAERCPYREAPKAPDERSKLEKTVEDWAQGLAEQIPKPQAIGWKTRIPVETENRQRIIAEDGHQIGIRSQIATEKSGPEILWQLKLQKEPCFSCAHFSREQFEDKDRVELSLFLQREAHWDEQAIRLILSDMTAYGVCLAHSEGADSMHVTHKNASCLRLYQPKKKGWLQSFGGKVFGGSKRHGF